MVTQTLHMIGEQHDTAACGQSLDEHLNIEERPHLAASRGMFSVLAKRNKPSICSTCVQQIKEEAN